MNGGSLPQTHIFQKFSLNHLPFNHFHPEKYFNYFGPWATDVLGPLLNSCVMKVIMTALNYRPFTGPVQTGIPPRRANGRTVGRGRA